MVSLEFALYRRVIASPDLSGCGNLIAGPVPKCKRGYDIAVICINEAQSDSFLNSSTTQIIPSVSSLQYLGKSARTLAISSSVALPYIILP